jgi:hypothetical protein
LENEQEIYTFQGLEVLHPTFSNSAGISIVLGDKYLLDSSSNLLDTFGTMFNNQYNQDYQAATELQQQPQANNDIDIDELLLQAKGTKKCKSVITPVNTLAKKKKKSVRSIKKTAALKYMFFFLLSC